MRGVDGPVHHGEPGAVERGHRRLSPGLPGAADQPTRLLTAEEISASPALASAKYMPVLGSEYRSFSSPAYPLPMDRLITTTLRARSTSRIGMPDTGFPGRLAAGLVTSLAPTTRATSIWGNCGLISSISLSSGYGTLASASSTFMWPGIRPATGWMAYVTSTPWSLRIPASSATSFWAW